METNQSDIQGCERSPFITVPEAVEAYHRGEIIIITDDEGRENEGDLVCAAEKITPETINFMSKHGRGLICIAMDCHLVEKFGLMRMSPETTGDNFKTAFMESVDAREGITTGISAFDRAHTIKVLLNDEGKPNDLVRPGHLFPLQAVDNGVLRRAGHTEAAVDLARMANLKPAGVICEVLNDDGSMARMPDLVSFAQKHNLSIISVADLVAYRRRSEKLIELKTTIQMPTKYGVFQLATYHSSLDEQLHLALTMDTPADHQPTLVRIHSECLTGDVFGSHRCDCGSQLDKSMRMIAEEGHGVVIYLRQEGRGIGLEKKLQAYALQEEGLDTVEANRELGFDADLRDYGIAAQILADQGIQRVRLLTNNPDKITGLQRYGVEVVERIPLVRPHTSHNEKYLETKKTKLGHLL